MGAANHTPRGLSQFTDNDKPTWRGDYNSDMLKIDGKFDAVGYDPADYGAVGNGVADDTAAVQAAIDAAKAAGGGRVILYRRYGWKGDLIQRGGVTVEGVSTSRFLTVPDHKDRGLVALDDTARYRYGMFTADSSDDNPGQLKNLIIDGNNVGGNTQGQLVLMESVNGYIDNCHIINSAKDALEVGGSQNGTIDNCYIGDSPNGAAISYWHRSGQGAGSMKLTNSYISTSRYLMVADQDPTNFWPHDCNISYCLFENYHSGNDIVEIRAGDFSFDHCVFTYSVSSGGGNVKPPNDCLIFAHQPTDEVVATRVNFDTCWFNGGDNALGTSDAVRAKAEGYGNRINFSGLQSVGNVGHLLCIDGGYTSYATYSGGFTNAGGVPKFWRAINGAIIPGIFNEEKLPTRWTVPDEATAALIGDPIQIRNESDATDRIRIASDGTIRWLDGTDPNTARASIQRDPASNVMHYGGAVEISNQFILRSLAQFITAVGQAVELDASSSAAPNWQLQFTAQNWTAVLTIPTTNVEIGTHLEIMISSGAWADTNSITWPANVTFQGEDPQPINGVKFVTLVCTGDHWVEASRSPAVNQFVANRVAGSQEVMPRELCSSEAATLAGYLLLSFFTATKDATISSIRTYTGGAGAGATPTLCRLGLYTIADNGDLTLVASTANDTTLWSQAFSTYNTPLSANYNVKRGTRYAIGFLVETTAAMPQWPMQTLSVMLASLKPKLCGFVGGQADLPAQIANGAVNAGASRYYAELVGI